MTDSPSKKSFLLRISNDLHDQIKSAADKNSVSMSAWITTAIRHWLDVEGAEAQRRSEQSGYNSDRVRTNWWK